MPNVMCGVSEKDRPKHCIKMSNLCCCFCNRFDDCEAEAEAMRSVRPCKKDMNTIEEPCPFGV